MAYFFVGALMGALMASTIPSSNRFRDYANVCSEFLSKPIYGYGSPYSTRLSLPFTTAEEQTESLALIHGSILPDYRKLLSEFEDCLTGQFKDVENYWTEDSAFMAANHRLLKRSGTRPTPGIYKVKLHDNVDSLLSTVDRVATRELNRYKYRTSSAFRERYLRSFPDSKLEPRATFKFKEVRELAEADIKWKQALAIVIANYLDRASYKLTQQVKDTAKKLASLISEFNAEIEKPEAKYLLSLGSPLFRSNSFSMAGLKGLEGFLASESLIPALSYREDKHLLHRTTAQEIMFANKWALDNERKDLAFILLGLAAFDEPLDIEQKTLERIWKKANANNSLIKNASYDGDRHEKAYRDIKTPQNHHFSVPNIPNIYLQNQEPK
jgi:hypothetical protein